MKRNRIKRQQMSAEQKYALKHGCSIKYVRELFNQRAQSFKEKNEKLISMWLKHAEVNNININL